MVSSVTLNSTLLAARNSYLQLLDAYNNHDGPKKPDNDCLAIARDYYCFVQFRRCRDNEKVSQAENPTNRVNRKKQHFALTHALSGSRGALRSPRTYVKKI